MRLSRLSLRAVLLRLHRWVGLSIGLFLCIAGLTGVVLVFHHELDAALNPELFEVGGGAPGETPLDPVALIEAVQRALPQAAIHSLPLDYDGTHAVGLFVEGAPGHGDPGFNQVFVDPWTGRVTGMRDRGDLWEGRPAVLPFVLRLHYGLALGDFGYRLMGVVALLWTLDCFVGFALTLPPRSPRAAAGPGASVRWLRRWWRSWTIKGRRPYTLAFTAHRALGLWLWALLLAIAWSAVGMNLPEVQLPVVKHSLGFSNHWSERQVLEEPRPTPLMGWDEALARTAVLLQAEARDKDFQIRQPERLRYHPDSGTWQLRAFSTLDVNQRYPGTSLWMDDRSGDLVQLDLPTGHTAGNTLTAWVDALHFGALFGMAGKLLTVGLGLLTALLSASGAWFWWRKSGRRMWHPKTRS